LTSIQDECPDQYMKTRDDTLGSSTRNARQWRKNRKLGKKTAALSSQTPHIEVKDYLEKLKDESMANVARKFWVVTLPSIGHLFGYFRSGGPVDRIREFRRLILVWFVGKVL
jgi:hypothetical protein